MKLTKQILRKMIKEELLNETEEDEGMINHYEAAIFDVIIDFKKVFDRTPWKKNRKIQSIIKQLLKLEQKLGDEIGELY